MQYFGDIELINGKIINLKVDPVTVLPDFTTDDESRFVYNLTDKTVYYNNGAEWAPLQVASFTSQPLVQSLAGSNWPDPDLWINADYSFNPTPFNNLANISGLTSTDSVFNVIEQLDNALTVFSDIDLNDINQISVSSLEAGQILYFDGVNFVNVKFSDIPDFSLNISLNSLSDVAVSGVPTDNQALFFDSSADKFVNKQWTFRYEQLSPQTVHVVNHNLTQQYCFVSVINPLTFTSITPTSIVYDNGNQLTVNLALSLPAIILVTTIPLQN